MDEHKLALEGKVSERTTELAETNVKLDRMTTHINELKQAIKEQEFSVDDIHKLESELKGLSEANDRAHSIRDQMRKMLLASEEELVAVCNDLDSVTSKYNGKIAEFQLVPDLGSKFSHMKSEVRKGKLLESDQSQILGVDLVGTVQQLAFSSNEKYLEKNNKATSQCQNFLDRMISAEDAYKEEDAKFQILQDKKSKFEQTLEKERKTLEAKLAVRQREVEAMENKIASLQDPVALEEQIASYERQCAELTALRIKHEEENVARYKSVVNELNSACQLMSDHDAFFHQTAAQVKAYWKEKTDAMVDIVSPTNLGDD